MNTNDRQTFWIIGMLVSIAWVLGVACGYVYGGAETDAIRAERDSLQVRVDMCDTTKWIPVHLDFVGDTSAIFTIHVYSEPTP